MATWVMTSCAATTLATTNERQGPEKDSQSALSQASPRLPIEASRPASRRWSSEDGLLWAVHRACDLI